MHVANPIPERNTTNRSLRGDILPERARKVEVNNPKQIREALFGPLSPNQSPIRGKVFDWIASQIKEPGMDDFRGILWEMRAHADGSLDDDLGANERSIVSLFCAFPGAAIDLVNASESLLTSNDTHLAFGVGVLSGLFLVGAGLKGNYYKLNTVMDYNVRSFDGAFMPILRSSLLRMEGPKRACDPNMPMISGLLANSIARYVSAEIPGRPEKIGWFMAQIDQAAEKDPTLMNREPLITVLRQLVAKSLGRIDTRLGVVLLAESVKGGEG